MKIEGHVIRANNPPRWLVLPPTSKRSPKLFAEAMAYGAGQRKPHYPVPAIRLKVIQQPSGAISVFSEDRDYSIVTWYNID